MKDGPYVSPEEAVAIFTTAVHSMSRKTKRSLQCKIKVELVIKRRVESDRISL